MFGQTNKKESIINNTTNMYVVYKNKILLIQTQEKYEKRKIQIISQFPKC